jgi:cell division control protein 45
MSVAQSVYLLATVLERADNDLLWFAILGATSQYLGGKVGRERYEAYHELFADEVVRLNIAPADSNSNGRDGVVGIGGKTPNPDDRSIARTDELRFMLFRHWTLYDAMLHSGYVAGRLGIWKEKGRKRLQGLLAKMG